MKTQLARTENIINILGLVEAGHFEVKFYLEMIWLYGAPEVEWAAAAIERKEVAPLFFY